MRVTLIVNPEAGAGKDGRRLVKKLERCADQVNLASTKGELARALRDPGDLVIVAGGDGTVAKVARRMIGRPTPILIYPTGTANNIASSLGIEKIELDLEKVLSAWRKQPIDAAVVDGEEVFESAGCGAIAHLIHIHSDDEREGLRREAKNLAKALDELPAFDYRITADSREIHGEAVLIEAMLIRQVGPNLRLAPEADPSDGLLDLVIATENEREPLRRYLASGARRKPPLLRTIKGSSFTIACDAPWHLDDELKPRRTRTITVLPGAWQAMVPP